LTIGGDAKDHEHLRQIAARPATEVAITLGWARGARPPVGHSSSHRDHGPRRGT